MSLRLILVVLILVSTSIFGFACTKFFEAERPKLHLGYSFGEYKCTNSFEENLLYLHNSVRLRPYTLELDDELNSEAQWWAEQMADMQELRHSNTKHAENIAMNYKDEKDVFDGWMGSTMGHRENIKDRKFKHVGFGRAKDSQGRWWWCAIFK